MHFLAQCIVLLLAFVSVTDRVVLGNDVPNIIDIDSSRWQKYLGGQQKVLVLFYVTENCEACAGALNTLQEIVGQPELPTDIEIGKSTDLTLAEELRITSFPSLIFLRDNSYVAYDDTTYEIERLLEWIQLAAQKTTVKLDDTSFEHFTQASTGATTGDWLVAFYKDSCDKVLPVMESLGVRVRNRINVAKVNADECPVLVERFKIEKCPEIIYFKQGRMYRYELPNLDVPSLRSFVDVFYKNVKHENVPVPKSKFDYLTEYIAGFIKQQLSGENRNAIIAGGGAAAGLFFLLTVCCCCCRSSGGQQGKQKRD